MLGFAAISDMTIAGLPVMSYYQSPTAFVPQIMEYPIQRRQLVAVGYR